MTNDFNQIDILLTRCKSGQFLSDRELVDLQPTNRDLATVKGLDNLAQAIINRLMTRQGELVALGHPNYGSRLHKLVGEQNNQRSQALAELYIRECLAQESRIAEVLEIIFANPKTVFERNTLKITINLKPVGTDTSSPLSIALNLNL
ncbi:MAG: GPW/gp25 family protein [Nostoc sp.]|uniref:GPW/gp25 family protein n=1 Tax=Nostoc sp. TaxID=1180 RepID=UPI002FF526AA